MASIFDWSPTASSNTTCDGINVNTGMSPANVDNVFRSIMSIIRGSFTSGLQNFLAGAGGAYLPIGYGGTGAGDTTTARQNLAALSSDYQDLPYRALSSSGTAADSDRGGAIDYTGAVGTFTLNPHATTPIGAANKIAVIVLFNRGTGALTITRGSGVTLKANGSTTDANSVLAIGGQATLFKFGTSDNWLVSGTGLS